MTAELLASGIKIIEKSENMHFDLILCGRESTDYIGGEVGGMLAAGRVAARLGGGSVNDAVNITAEEGIITAIRPVFGGTIRETVQVRAKPAVISIRAGSYDVPENVLEASRRAAAKAEMLDAAGEQIRTISTSYIWCDRELSLVTSAEEIV